MAKELDFEGRVVVVTGAGNGLGRSHAKLFASRGARVIVNDLGGSHTGDGASTRAADQVVAEIKEAGGQAAPNYDSVTDGAKIIESAIKAFGRIDVVINNAGILRDVSFQKMTDEDWDKIYQVHVLGAYKVTRAAWAYMRDQGYGRIVMTSSAAGIYGNFGQANYAMAKLGLNGFARSLAIEGQKKNVFVNTIAPIAGSRMTETVLPPELIKALDPAYVSPLVVWLAHHECTENGGLFEVGGGYFGKLRWERTEGATFRLGRTISPESVRERFGAITSFEKVTHPENIADSMKPIMKNVEAGESLGGNEFIDVDQALGYEYPAHEFRYDERDAALYALAIGAGENPTDENDLRYVYELSGKGFTPLPTFAVIPAIAMVFDHGKKGIQAPGLKFGLDRVLHGEQYVEILRPIPPKAKLETKAKVTKIFDKGKGALVITEMVSSDASGPLFKNELTTFVRGAGGWGGDRGPSADVNVAPERAPDAVVEQKTSPNQALLYRLTGDWNPLHADPSFAKAFGFERPILHGLCTFGYAARHVLSKFAPQGDARFLKSIKVRFAETVLPGETLVTEMWKDGDRRVVFRSKVKERDKVVISNAAIEFFAELPKEKAPDAPKAAAAPAEARMPTAADIFKGIGGYVADHPELAGKIGKIFTFRLTGPDSVWTMDFKNAPGSVFEGVGAPADTTLELSNADWLAMATGQADPQKLYFGGKLKISGDLMASQKLTFLSKIKPEEVAEEVMKRKASGGAPKPVASSNGSRSAVAGKLFEALKSNAAKKLASQSAGKLQFVIAEPDAAAPTALWIVDLEAQDVRQGSADSPTATLTIADADLEALSRGQASAASLFQRGKLRIDGNVKAARELSFLEGLL